ncbi:MAG: hypothetical protein JWO15_2857 [Sphingomonadales bacterium]|jgi:hypothetical protein|nr:hypothetical protein [Sphingomonadales bacterium]
MKLELRLPRNPDFGSGLLRRVIRLTNVGNAAVAAHLIDNYHEMRCRLAHDGTFVTAIEGEIIRYPTTACPGSPASLDELRGLRLDTPGRLLYDTARLRRNCTHMFDIAALSMKHAMRSDVTRTYVAEIPDQIDQPVEIMITCNGQGIHRWTVDQDLIVEPADLAGLPTLQGFTKWAAEKFVGENLEAAFVLSRACFISKVRPYAPKAGKGMPLTENAALIGACYAYSAQNIENGRFIGEPSRLPRRP